MTNVIFDVTDIPGLGEMTPVIATADGQMMLLM
jgi:hypothetical protein